MLLGCRRGICAGAEGGNNNRKEIMKKKISKKEQEQEYINKEIKHLLTIFVEKLQELPKQCQIERLKVCINRIEINLFDNESFGYCVYCGREDEVENE